MKYDHQKTAKTCDNENNNDWSMDLIQCTGTGRDGKDCVAW